MMAEAIVATRETKLPQRIRSRLSQLRKFLLRENDRKTEEAPSLKPPNPHEGILMVLRRGDKIIGVYLEKDGIKVEHRNGEPSLIITGGDGKPEYAAGSYPNSLMLLYTMMELSFARKVEQAARINRELSEYYDRNYHAFSYPGRPLRE